MIDIEQNGDVLILRLNAPPLNTFDFAALEELRGAMRQAAGQQDVRGVVITGGAKHFSAGADVHLFQEIETAADAVRVSLIFQEALAAIENCPKPVAAAVAGKLMGGALELAMACHLRVCETRTRFSMPEVMLGINPGAWIAIADRLAQPEGTWKPFAPKGYQRMLFSAIQNADQPS